MSYDDYYLDDEFNNRNFNINNFLMLHINDRSLHTNIDKITVFCAKLNHLFSIIAVSETWANESNILHI